MTVDSFFTDQRGDWYGGHSRGTRRILQTTGGEMCHQEDQLGKVEHQHGRVAEGDSGNVLLQP